MKLSDKKYEIKYDKKTLFLVFYIVFTLFLLYVGTTTAVDRRQLNDAVAFSEGWDYEVSSDQNLLTARRMVTQEMVGKALSFHTTDSYVDVYLNGEELYHFGQEPRFGTSPGSYWQFVDIPYGAVGQELTVAIRTVYDYKFLEEYDFELGSSGGMVISYLLDEAGDFFVNLLIFFLGIIMCVMYGLEHKNGVNRQTNLFLGLFSILFAAWSSAPLFLNQLLIPRAIVQYYTYYFSLFVLPALLLCYLESLDEKLSCKVEFIVHMVMLAVLMVLHFTGILEFTHSIVPFLVVAVLELLSMCVKITKVIRKNRLVMTAMLVLIGFVILNALEFFLNMADGAGSFLGKVGLSIYLVVAVYSGMSQLLKDIAAANEGRLLKKIAYTDSLTGIANRYAFDRDIHTIPLKQVCIVSMDLNNLKYFNDVYGHIYGDILIKEAARIMLLVYDRVYRVGGDEFWALLEGKTSEELRVLQEKLMRQTEEYNESDDNKVLLEIACGSSAYQEEDASYKDILKRADEEMYQNKEEIKKHSKLKVQRRL